MYQESLNRLKSINWFDLSINNMREMIIQTDAYVSEMSCSSQIHLTDLIKGWANETELSLLVSPTHLNNDLIKSNLSHWFDPGISNKRDMIIQTDAVVSEMSWSKSNPSNWFDQGWAIGVRW